MFIATMLAMLILPLGVSYFSGHIVDELIISLYLGFIAGFVLQFVREEKINEKISIIMPVYNAEKFVDNSIKSLLNQTLKDIEIILVNDGSKDNSLDILKVMKINMITL